MSNNGINLGSLHGTTPKYRLFSQQPTGGTTAPTPYATDSLQLNPVGGNADYQALLQQTDQMMQSPDMAQRYRAIVNITRMQPADAIPRLQAAAAVPGQDPQVVSLAQQALAVMQRQAATAPQTNVQQPGVQQPTTAQPTQQPYVAPTTPAYNPGVQMAAMSQEDAGLTMQMLMSELAAGGEGAINAIKGLSALQASNPGMKDNVLNILINHIYNKDDASVPEALRALGAINDPRALPYIAAVARRPGVWEETRRTAMQILDAAAAQQQNGVGVASTNGNTMSVENIRMIETKLNENGSVGANALAQLRQALGNDPKAQTPARAEINRVLITYVATKSDPVLILGATQMLGEMKSRESLRYLEALARTPGISEEMRNAARNSMRQIMQP